MVPHESCLVRTAGWMAGLVLALMGAGGVAAPDVHTPHLSFASVDWSAAIANLPMLDLPPAAARSTKARLGGGRPPTPALARLNGITSPLFPGVATSPVPVLLPFDVAALMRDRADGVEADL